MHILYIQVFVCPSNNSGGGGKSVKDSVITINGAAVHSSGAVANNPSNSLAAGTSSDPAVASTAGSLSLIDNGPSSSDKFKVIMKTVICSITKELIMFLGGGVYR